MLDNIFAIIQYNMHNSGSTQSSFLRELDPHQHHVIAVQEPNVIGQGKTRTDPRYHLVFPTSLPARTCMYVSKEIPTSKWKVDEKSGFFTTLTLELGERTVHIHNCYNQPNSTSSRDLGTLIHLQQALEREGEHVLLGDFNLHHPRWGGGAVFTQHNTADYLISQTEEAGMSLLLEPGTVTRKDRNGTSTLDLIFATTWIENRVRECRVASELENGSDHEPIITTIDMHTPITTPAPSRPQWKRAAWGEVGAILDQRLGIICHTELNSQEDIDNYAKMITTICKEVIDEHIPKARPCTWTSPAWSQECGDLIKQARKARRIWSETQLECDYIAYQTINNSKKRQIRRDKTKTWRRAVEAATSDNSKVWKLAKWARTKAMEPHTLPQFPPLIDCDGRLQHSYDGKARVLAARFFPQPAQADLTDIAYAQYPEGISIEQQITTEHVLGTIMCLPPDKAPGPDGIVNRFLRHCKESLAAPLARLFDACLRNGYYPQTFKHSTTVVLRKPHKQSYSEPGSYRPIALMSTIGKVLERIIARRIAEAVEEHQLLPDTQMGARRGRSTETALELITEQVRTAWACDPKVVVTMLSLDISGAFDNAVHERLLHNMRQARIPIWVVNFIRSFLNNRTTQLYFDGESTAKINTHTGIPQGSSLCPILFLFFAAPLLQELDKGKTAANGFVDDTNIITCSRSAEENCRVLEEAHEKCLNWARKHGATFAPGKYQLLHLTRQRKRLDIKATINIQGFHGQPSAFVKVLGVQVDSKLKWGPHIKYATDKGRQKIASLTRLTGSTWGASFARARHIYTAVVRPTMTFAASTWHGPKGVEGASNAHLQKLEKVQNQCLRKIAGAYKTTGIKVLEHETGILPLRDYLDTTALKYSVRGGTNGPHRAVARGCIRIEKMFQEQEEQLRERNRNLRRRRGRPRTENTTANTPRRVVLLAKAKEAIQSAPAKGTESARLQSAAMETWKQNWDRHMSDPRGPDSTAKTTAWNDKMLKLRQGLTRAESTIATLLRTEHIGLNDYLYRRRVPDHNTPACTCGARRQTPKHILLFCPDWGEGRLEMLRRAGTSDFRKLLSTRKGLKAASSWFLDRGILSQFSLAREMAIEEASDERR